jgi:hypothetical protein
MTKRRDEQVARLVELARERVAEKLHGQPDPVPVWAYRTIIRTVLVELRREE